MENEGLFDGYNKKWARIYLLSILSIIFFFLQSENVQASCYKIALIGDTGQVIKPDGLATAMKIGKENIFVDVLPNHRETKIIGPVDCPKYLYDAILSLYNSSCTTNTSINQMAENTKNDRKKVINKCAELKYALTSANFLLHN